MERQDFNHDFSFGFAFGLGLVAAQLLATIGIGIIVGVTWAIGS